MRKYKLLVAAMVVASMFVTPVFAEDLQEDFLKDMSEGLAGRWSYSEDENAMTKKEFVEYRTKVVAEETSRLDKYIDETFDNEKFDLLAHAYIEAIDNQLASLKYYEELENIYEIEWSAGYNVRAALLPVFVDSYGLIADEEAIQEFRDNDSYSMTVTDTYSEGIASSEQELQVYNNEGISIYVTGFNKDDYSKKLYLRIENLNHHDIIVGTKDYHAVINGVTVDCSLWEEVASGKTTTGMYYFPKSDSSMAGIDEIKDISFAFSIIDASSYDTLYTSDTVYLSVDETNETVSSRIVYNDKDTIRKVQELLNSAGYECGTADGVPGKDTNSAIIAFEKDHNLPVDTDITLELLETLQAEIEQDNCK